MTTAERRAALPEPRFEFGKNWRHFSRHVDEERMAHSERWLRERLGLDDLTGKSFLDIGSGSGLSSLAARRLGARVHSFDLDPDSVTCTRAARDCFCPDAALWKVECGDVLDDQYVSGLGTFDIVCAWGVLHHTGHMWRAIDNAATRVAPGGLFLLALYNDGGLASTFWKMEKRLYNQAPQSVGWAVAASYFLLGEARRMFARLRRSESLLPFEDWRRYKANRGMSRWHDAVDWVGGYPFEVARPDAVLQALTLTGFTVERVVAGRTSGANNEFLFHRPDRSAESVEGASAREIDVHA